MKEIKSEKLILLSTGRKACPGSPFDREAAANAVRFHKSLPMYGRTRLVSLKSAAEELGVKAIFLKDESTRFGLKAFKGLGGSYAVFRVLCGRLGLDPHKAVYSDFLTEENRQEYAKAISQNLLLPVLSRIAQQLLFPSR